MATKAEERQHRELIESIRLRLQGLPAGDSTDRWLVTVYEVKTDRFIAENEKIWVTGRIFITVSLAAFAAWAALKPASWVHVVVLMALSISLLVVWYFVSETHRRFQSHHEAWLDAIEEFKGINVEFPPRPKFPPSIDAIRTWLIWIVLIIWLLILGSTVLSPTQSRSHEVPASCNHPL